MKQLRTRLLLSLVFAAGFALLAAGCASTDSQKPAAAFSLSTSVISGGKEVGFDSGIQSVGRLQTVYGSKPGDAPNHRSFPFSWTNLPSGTKALAVILDDPDAKPVLAAYGMSGDFFLHWIATDIDPSLGGLADDAAASASFPQGKNGTGQVGYTAPQPPADIPKDTDKTRIHVYRLKVYALSAQTGLASGFSLDELLTAIKDKTLGKAELDVSYSNQ